MYPRRLVDRPLLLPEGGFELGLPLSFRNDQSSLFNPYALYATPVFQLEAGINYQLGDRPNRDTDLSAFFVGGRRELVPCRVPGLAIGTQLVFVRPTGDLPGFSPNLLVDYRRKVARFLAIQPHAGIGYDYARLADDQDNEGTVHQLDGSVALKVELQAGSVFAFELNGSLGYFHDLGDYSAFGIASHSVQSLSLGMLLSITENADLRFLYSRSMHSWQFSSDGIVLALDVRRI